MSPLRRNSQPVPAVLPVEGTVTVPGRFTFGLPWPWREDQAPGARVDAAGNPMPQAALVAVFAPRSQGEARFLVWPGGGPAGIVFNQLHGQLLRIYGVVPTARQNIRLGGERAVLADLTTGGWHVSRLVSASPHGYVLNGEFRVPALSAPGYRPHLQTMVATWRWL